MGIDANIFLTSGELGEFGEKERGRGNLGSKFFSKSTL